jgi:UDP-3-O-[3-hydroxymyristoyl] N-acetylglucosamine deacetylase
LLDLKISTLKQNVSCSGIGIHTGETSSITFSPSKTPGIFFVKGKTKIPASIENVVDTQRGVTLENEGARIKTVEHLLAALCWLGLVNLEIHVEGEEIPIMDGSAKPWIELLQPHIQETNNFFPLKTIQEEFFIQEGNAWIYAKPANHLEIEYEIDFPNTPIGNQIWRGNINQSIFLNELSPARTFGFLEEIEALHKQGLGKGGKLDTCVVVTKDFILTPLRFKEEMARHKVLDLLGDLALLGSLPLLHLKAFKASHRLHTRLARKLAENG